MIPGYTLIGNKEPVQNTPNEVIKPDKDSQGINTELHQKINNREEGHYYKLQQQKNIESTGLPNYSIKPLTDIKDPALNVDKVRSYLQENSVDYIKGKYNVEDISVATAKVTTKDGKVENILSVSGRAWNGNAPKEVTIDNVKYKVIIKDSESVKTYTGISQNGNKVWNLNHAEKKLASYIQDNYSGKEVKVDIGVQNTSKEVRGMCPNCNSSMFDFAKDNPDMRITIYEGTTGKIRKGKEYKMNKRYMDILKEYLKKNERKAIGYSEEEITKIEKLYDIEAKGDFREFLKYAGRCDGDLLGDDPIILYRQTWNIDSYLRMNYFGFIDDEDFEEKVFYDELKKKPFIFSIEMENYYFYIRTADDDLKVYCFDENEEKIKDTGMDFNEYMVDLVERYTPELKPTLDFSTVGELLVQCDTSEKRITGLREIKEYISSERKENSEFFILLERYLEKNKKEFIGYNDDEIRGIEKLYNIEVKGDFREYLSIVGKSLGGLLGEEELSLYNDWSIRERILLQYDFQEYVQKDKFRGKGRDGKPFIIDLKSNSEYIFITTRDNDLKVYHYSRENRTLKETGKNFSEYVTDLIKRYNPELEELKDVSVSGDIINI